MNRASSSTGAGGEGPRTTMNHRRGDVPANLPSSRIPYLIRRPEFQHNFRQDRSPAPPPPRPTSSLRPRHNFTIQLRYGNRSVDDVEDIVARCNSKAENFLVNPRDPVTAELFFKQWTDALEAMLCLWKIRLQDGHLFTLYLSSHVLLPSDRLELNDRLKLLFAEWAKDLMEGDLVEKWTNKLMLVTDEIAKVNASLGYRNKISTYNELLNKKAGLNSERVLIERKIEEFNSAMKCMVAHFEGKSDADSGDEVMEIFKFENRFNWERIHHLILRECRRFNDGLPIYAFRQELLRHIYSQQIMVLIGETGSGKSTQLLQYLADSGFDADGSIICTQPRKLAAISLARRVQEECSGCYPSNSIVCRPTYTPATQQAEPKVIYMTDHCLLQHYMKDKNLSSISCIVIDEAHERSLNTDLLLALLKSLLHQRRDLRLIIMSATVDADKLANYFFGCGTFHVTGRNFPVDINYVPCASIDTVGGFTGVSPYVSEVVRMAGEINRTEKEGGILAFLTSQMEVEWACEKFQGPSSIALPLHGKLSCEDQHRIFLNYPGKRKVIFATNIAETSLTIPGVKYVVDSGMVKDSKFEPGSGMNVLRVNKISQSSANQRAGRAGRTEPGKCFRLYSEDEYESMLPHQEPEIRKVHLGVAVLRILALGISNVESFDFVDAPSTKAIEMAVKNLVQLGAVTWKNEVLELTEEGRALIKLGIEPRLGKIILGCFRHRLAREGLVLAAVMANYSSIFCRVGTEENKQKSDCLKVQFCHRDGDLFTLLSVYKEWEAIPQDKRNKWCWDNSINAKSLRRCHDTVQELDTCLRNELNYIIPSYWLWDPHTSTEHDMQLKKIILSALAENVAIYSGYDELGYQVALTGKHVQLHPSSSLRVFCQRPSWVVFGDILSVSSEYLVCVTTVDFDSLSTLSPPLPCDVSRFESEKLHEKTLTGYGSTLLKKFCGRYNSNLHHLVSRIRTACKDERIGIDVNVNQNKIMLFASETDMENVHTFVLDALEFDSKLLYNECMEKFLYHGGPGVSSSLALFGAGAEIRHLELDKRVLTVDINYANTKSIDDRELLALFEKYTSGTICEVHKFLTNVHDGEENDKWGRISFLTPDAAQKARELHQVEFNGSLLKVVPSRSNYRGDHKMFSFPAVKAKVFWPRRRSKGFGILKCDSRQDVDLISEDLSNLVIGDNYIRCEPSVKSMDSAVITGLDKDLSEAEILDTLRMATGRRILDFFLVRGDAVANPPAPACEEALLRELSGLMPKRSPNGHVVRVQVFPSEPKDSFMKALISFDGSFHLEAAKALEEIEGKVLLGCLPWQKIKCQQLFQSTISCPAPVYFVIKRQLDSLLASVRHRKGAECVLDRNENGSYRVKISSIATKTVAELRARLEQLMRGKIVSHPRLSPTVLQPLFSRDGIFLMKSLQREMGTFIMFDRQNMNVRVFGLPDKMDIVERRLVESLVAMHESKQLEVHLRGGSLPPDLMKEVVKAFGPDLHGLKERVPEADFTLSTRRHVISVHGNLESKQKVEDAILEVAQTSIVSEKGAACPICLCEVEDNAYRLEQCGHVFCNSCLVEQCDSAIKSRDNIPITCVQSGCGARILLADLRLLLPAEKLEELFRASLTFFVAGNFEKYRFCPSPDCPSVYEVAGPGDRGRPFVCGACYMETCTRCHLEYHPYLTCEKYKEFKEDPDSSLKEWSKDKEHVKQCPVCGFTIEKVDGCNHIECKCGRHICWVCLEYFGTSENCYDHLRSIHFAIM